jgi:PIN domain nuclease of toxin-antitoxin system
VSVRQHALVQDSRNQDTTSLLAIEHHVSALLHTAKAGANMIAEPAERWIVTQPLATNLKLIKIDDGLRLTPPANGVIGDAKQIIFRETGKSKLRHG